MELPASFIDYTRALLGDEEYDKLAVAIQQEPPVSIRLNDGKLKIENGKCRIVPQAGCITDFQLSAFNFEFNQVPWSSEGFYLDERLTFTFDPLFHAGCYYVQEASSMFVEQVLRQYVTGPVKMLDLCDGTHMSAALFDGWADGVTTQQAIVNATNFESPIVDRYVSQALGYYVANGVAIQKDTDRAYCTLLKPVTGDDNYYGYIIGYTYSADSPFFGDPKNANRPTGGKVPGSFTWKLKPRGVRDLTPNEEVNESSTVYEINMSQSGVNMNNYKDWENYVNGQGKDKNKIRINIYRISEPLPNDKMATEYKRGQITSGGQSILNPVDRVVRGDLTIDNVPVIDSNTVIM